MAGISGRREIAAVAEMARGRVSREEVSRQGALPVKVLGEAVRVIAYESRR